MHFLFEWVVFPTMHLSLTILSAQKLVKNYIKRNAHFIMFFHIQITAQAF